MNSSLSWLGVKLSHVITQKINIFISVYCSLIQVFQQITDWELLRAWIGSKIVFPVETGEDAHQLSGLDVHECLRVLEVVSLG